MRASRPRYSKLRGPIGMMTGGIVITLLLLSVYFYAEVGFRDAFWPDFTSGLLSTGLGLLLGIPAGLFLNRQFVRQEEDARRTADLQLLFEALETLSTALLTNRNALAAAVKVIDEGKGVPVDIELDPTTWAVVQDVVVQHLGKPSLQRDLAVHFYRIGRYAAILSLFLERSSGIDGISTTEVAVRTRVFTKIYLRDRLNQAKVQAGELAELVDRCIVALKAMR